MKLTRSTWFVSSAALCKVTWNRKKIACVHIMCVHLSIYNKRQRSRQIHTHIYQANINTHLINHGNRCCVQCKCSIRANNLKWLIRDVNIAVDWHLWLDCLCVYYTAFIYTHIFSISTSINNRIIVSLAHLHEKLAVQSGCTFSMRSLGICLMQCNATHKNNEMLCVLIFELVFSSLGSLWIVRFEIQIFNIQSSVYDFQ